MAREPWDGRMKLPPSFDGGGPLHHDDRPDQYGMKRTVVRIRPRLVNVWLHVAPVVSVPESKRLAFLRPFDRHRMVAPCRRTSCRYAGRLHPGAGRGEVPGPPRPCRLPP